jgi:hypothetical protein
MERTNIHTRDDGIIERKFCETCRYYDGVCHVYSMPAHTDPHDDCEKWESAADA